MRTRCLASARCTELTSSAYTGLESSGYTTVGALFGYFLFAILQYMQNVVAYSPYAVSHWLLFLHDSEEMESVAVEKWRFNRHNCI